MSVYLIGVFINVEVEKSSKPNQKQQKKTYQLLDEKDSNTSENVRGKLEDFTHTSSPKRYVKSAQFVEKFVEKLLEKTILVELNFEQEKEDEKKTI